MPITEKSEHWIKEFSLPLPKGIYKLALLYNISETALNRKFYSMLESGKFAPCFIIDYLSKYSDNISDRLIDKLLETVCKYADENAMKDGLQIHIDVLNREKDIFGFSNFAWIVNKIDQDDSLNFLRNFINFLIYGVF